MLEKLFKKEWHTDTILVTDEKGQASFDGFYGDYEISVLTENESVHKVSHKRYENTDDVIIINWE